MGSREKQSSDKMRSLLVLTVASLASAAPQFYGLPLTYSSPLTYTYTPQGTKLGAKNIEVPVEVAKFSVKETGCVNSFGLNVPCAQEGEARRKRSADEEEAEAAPAAPVLTYGLPYAAGLPYAGLGYAGLGYAGLGYTSYALPSVKIAEPKVTEVEVPTYSLKPVEKNIELAPLCNNAAGWPVPCA